jgi:hypothetical protein
MATDDELRATVERAAAALVSLPESATTKHPAPGKWTPRQIVGHLIDSATNNHRRFVLAQFQDDLVFDGYDQDAWVAAQRYNEESWRELVQLWRAVNVHLAHVMAATPEADRRRPRARHNLDRIAFRPVPSDRPATLQYFMDDYVEHLEHHLRQILGDDWEEG